MRRTKKLKLEHKEPLTSENSSESDDTDQSLFSGGSNID
jgi:hypothetical protein